MRFLTSWPGKVLMALVVLLAIGGGYVYYDQQRVQVLRIGTSGAGNISHTVSMALSKVAAREYPRLRLEIVETKGAVENMRLLHEGKVDLAFAQSDIPAAPEARLVAHVHPQLFHLIVPTDSTIRSVADLKGKRVGTPGKGGGSYNAFVVLMKHYDLAPEDFASFRNLPSSQLVKDLLGGELDAVFGSDAYGEERPRQLLGSGRARLIPIDQAAAMRLTLPYISAVTIPKGAYKANPPIPGNDLDTVAIQSSLLAHRDVEASLVQEVARLLFDYRLELIEAAPQLTALTSPLDTVREGMAVHEGARAFFERDKPSFLEENPDYIALLLTLLTMGGSGLLAMRSRLNQVKKKRGDQYNQEIVNLMELVQNSNDLEQLGTAESKLLTMFRLVVDAKDKGELESDSLEQFVLTWNQALQTVRHRQLVVGKSAA